MAARQEDFRAHVVTLEGAAAGADAPCRAAGRVVSILGVDDQTAFVADGLVGGDKVAGRGAFKLREGILVKVADKSDTNPP